MKTLVDLGISLNNSSTPLLHVEQDRLGTEDFFAQSSELLPQLAAAVNAEVIPNLDKYEGTWHPSGFMVFPLGTHEELGILRLHIWPNGLRRRVFKGREQMADIYDGDIHNHAWNVASYALEYYCDNLYSVEETTEASDDDLAKNHDLFRIFNVTYGPDAYQALTTTGRTVKASLTQQRESARGEMHMMDTSVFHAPTIPLDKLGATLAFNSFRVHNGGPDVLIGAIKEPLVGSRRPISADEAKLALEQLTQAQAVAVS